MAIVSINCPNCNGALELDDSKEFGFCMFCGTQVRVQDEKTRIEVSGSVTFDETEKYNNFLNLAAQAYTAENMDEAYHYYTKALEIKQSDYLPVFRKALCAGYLSTDSGMRMEEVVSGISRAFDMMSDDATKSKMSVELVAFARDHKPDLSTDFYSSDDCARYVKALFNKVSLLNRLYPFVNKDCAEETIQYIDLVTGYCRLLKVKTLSFKAGTKVEKGKSKTVYGTYPIPQNIVHEAADIAQRLTAEYNKYILPKIKILKTDIAETKKQIKALPPILQVSNYICSWWVFLIGLLTLQSGVGILILVAQLVFLFISNKDKAAKALFKQLTAQKKELLTLRKQLRK